MIVIKKRDYQVGKKIFPIQLFSAQKQLLNILGHFFFLASYLTYFIIIIIFFYRNSSYTNSIKEKLFYSGNFYSFEPKGKVASIAMVSSCLYSKANFEVLETNCNIIKDCTNYTVFLCHLLKRKKKLLLRSFVCFYVLTLERPKKLLNLCKKYFTIITLIKNYSTYLFNLVRCALYLTYFMKKFLIRVDI